MSKRRTVSVPKAWLPCVAALLALAGCRTPDIAPADDGTTFDVTNQCGRDVRLRTVYPSGGAGVDLLLSDGGTKSFATLAKPPE